MKSRLIAALVATMLVPQIALADSAIESVSKSWTFSHSGTGVTDFEPEYIAINNSGTKAYVTLQEANAIGIFRFKQQ